uniref:Uncharacterized protein n=1 Tax=Mus musculus TaxID=10090 RepID=Q3V0U8_MOUSE|nr:unnamed protein product [Mus musculus]
MNFKTSPVLRCSLIDGREPPHTHTHTHTQLMLELGDLIVWKQRQDSKVDAMQEGSASFKTLYRACTLRLPPPFRSRPKQNSLGALWHSLTISGTKEAAFEK